MTTPAEAKKLKDKLKRKFAIQKAKLTNVAKIYDDPELITSATEISIKIQYLEDSAKEVESIMDQYACVLSDEEYNNVEESFLEYDHKYHSVRAKLMSLVPGDKESQDGKHMNDDSNHTLKRLGIKLPNIQLKVFTGNRAEWVTFKDTYLAVIHSNKELSEIVKFTYLLSILSGDARATIGHITLSEAGYQKAWEELNRVYDDSRAIIDVHIEALYNLPNTSKDSASDLRNLLNLCINHISSLEACKQEVSGLAELMILHMVGKKLDINLKKDYENQLVNNELPTWKSLLNFLQKRCKTLESVSMDVSKKSNSNNMNKNITNLQVNKKPPFSQNIKPKSSSFVVSATNNDTQAQSVSTKQKQLSCVVCKGQQHPLFLCEAFRKLSVFERFMKIKELRYCFNCFNPFHNNKACTSRGCKECNQKHHTLLHRYDVPNQTEAVSSKESTTNTTTVTNIDNNENSFSNCAITKNFTKQIILSTAIVLIQDKNGQFHECRALLDSASQSNFITQNLASKLDIPLNSINELTIRGINQIKTTINTNLSTSIKSKYKHFMCNLDFLLVPIISNALPQNNIDISLWSIPGHLKLADPHFNYSKPIDILLGAEIFFNIMTSQKIELKPNLPILQETLLGWIVSGKLEEEISQNFCLQNFNNVKILDSLDETIKKFWELENIPSKRFLSAEESQCERLYSETHYRNNTGRYTVSLPIRPNMEMSGDSKTTALKRFSYLEKKFEQNSDFKQQYISFINEYISLGHMKLSTSNPYQISYFLPHHAILKPTSSTTKLRVVFDASAKTSTNVSLNDILITGPTVQNDLFQIILRFRKHQFVITADIAKMYRQIYINPNQTCLQKIVWRPNPNEEIKTYELATVTYGTSAAPYLATRTLNQLAIDEAKHCPIASKTVLNDCYIDDILNGSNSINDTLTLQQQLIDMLNKGGFELHKWCSNHEALIENIPEEHREKFLNDDNNDSASIKALGLFWQPKKDNFVFNIQLPQHHKILTKRIVLSEIGKFYDPLGLLAPAIIVAKLLIQKLWQSHLGWDDTIKHDDSLIWNKFRNSVLKLNEISLPRCVILQNTVRLELHGFADASQKAYGACVYVKSIDSHNNVSVQLLCAKSRVAPLKVISIPRLELCAALLLSNLITVVINSMELNFSKILLWSDSSIVLYWINTPPHKLKTFVANRVNEIQEQTVNFNWLHIGSIENPADVVSRGVYPDELYELQIWWNGPSILYKHDYNYSNDANFVGDQFNSDILELKEENIVVATTIQENLTLFVKYSSYKKLLRVTAYCLRFFHNLKYPTRRNIDSLSPQELDHALLRLIKNVQQQSFHSEINLLIRNQELPKNNKLAQLNIFLDKNGLLRVGGRLTNTNFEYDIKHQLLLPKEHVFTKLLFENEHVRQLHAGPQLLLSIVRQRFWPINGKNLAKQTVRRCVTCFKTRPLMNQQIMGNLPSERVTSNRPFNICGVDFCGPFFMKNKYQRTASAHKIYVASFVCFVTKSIHLEIVSDLTSDSFIACLKRFISRRGKVSTIWSDNAKTFIGARNEMRQLFDLFKNQSEVNNIENFCTSELINWKFIPPRAPNFGGLWEASIKSFKTHLKRVTNGAYFTYEEFNTLIIQIEGILNSRPLTVLSSDPNDPEPLTPGHFLTGGAIVALIEPNLEDVNSNHLTTWNKITKMTHSFWKRFSIEYVHSLQQRTKWKKTCPNINEGDVVLLADDNIPTTQWLLGLVVRTIVGNDSKVRVVEVKTRNGIFKRSVTKISKLPIN